MRNRKSETIEELRQARNLNLEDWDLENWTAVQEIQINIKWCLHHGMSCVTWCLLKLIHSLFKRRPYVWVWEGEKSSAL